MDDRTKLIRLMDFYGPLITEHRLEILKLRLEEDMSLSEIAEEKGVTRQGVHDAIVKAEAKLTAYEQKLGLVAKYDLTREYAGECAQAIDAGDLDAAKRYLEIIIEQ